MSSFPFLVFLQNLVQQVVQHHRAGAGPDHGHVLLLVGAADADEHAGRVPDHHHRGAGRAAL